MQVVKRINLLAIYAIEQATVSFRISIAHSTETKITAKYTQIQMSTELRLFCAV